MAAALPHRSGSVSLVRSSKPSYAPAQENNFPNGADFLQHVGRPDKITDRLAVFPGLVDGLLVYPQATSELTATFTNSHLEGSAGSVNSGTK